MAAFTPQRKAKPDVIPSPLGLRPARHPLLRGASAWKVPSSTPVPPTDLSPHPLCVTTAPSRHNRGLSSLQHVNWFLAPWRSQAPRGLATPVCLWVHPEVPISTYEGRARPPAVRWRLVSPTPALGILPEAPGVPALPACSLSRAQTSLFPTGSSAPLV